jgi:acyl dehydratase
MEGIRSAWLCCGLSNGKTEAGHAADRQQRGPVVVATNRGGREVTVTVPDLLEEELKIARQVIGKPTTPALAHTHYFNEEATRDTIRHYALGVSDFNPLWLDEDYARKSRFGTIVAPPTFTYSVHRPSIAHWLVRLPGDEPWGIVNGGCAWTFHDKIKLGDRIHITARLSDAQLKNSKTFEHIIVLTSDVDYWDQNDRLVAHASANQVRYLARFASVGRTEEVQGRKAQPGATATDLTPPQAGMQAAQSRRGATPRYWEDVKVGEPLPDLPMGRLGVADIINWQGGTAAPTPPGSFVHPGEHERSEGWHDPESARERYGVPMAFDNGPLRSGWLSQLVTNWMGDDGDLRRMQYSLRAFNVVGDVNTIKGSVVGKRLDQGDALVDLEIWVENDRGVRTVPGTATVKLPQRRS